ncbi:MAG TPA: hypothetical protein VM487_03850 [Phycisphaerae bacterium]|nr:hypothetical protein [Phycisphaerae bacterium]
MPTTLRIRDESVSGETLGESVLEFVTERITVRELIRSRVYQEVQDYNLRRTSRGPQLVQLGAADRVRNGKAHTGGQVDWKPQVESAIKAFEQNRVIIVVGDRQVESLDDEITIAPETCVTFLKVVPLAGG